MPLSRAEVSAIANRARWQGKTPEQRQRATQPARLALAVNSIVKNWPELTDEQRAQIRAQVIESRRDQGFPDHITDQPFLGQLARAVDAVPVAQQEGT